MPAGAFAQPPDEAAPGPEFRPGLRVQGSLFRDGAAAGVDGAAQPAPPVERVMEEVTTEPRDDLVASQVDLDANPEEPAEGGGYERGFLKNWAALPMVLYTPETQVIGSLLGVYFFPLGDPETTRPSSVKGVAAISTRGQILANVEDELWFDANRWRLKNIFQYRSWPDTFYGIGNDTRSSDAEGFTYERFQLISKLERIAWRNLYLGVVQHAELVDVVDAEQDGILDTQPVPGGEGGWASGLGLSITWDGRDSALYPTRGGFYRFEASWYASFLGSDYAFGMFDLDLRQYVTPWLDHVVAFQLRTSYAPGHVPFTLMPTLGGSRNLRGLYAGRFRDQGAITSQVEYRFPLFWRFKAVAFAGAGQVFDDWSELDPRALHYTAGGGLRFQISEDRPAHVRCDVGWSPDDGVSFYLQVLEAF